MVQQLHINVAKRRGLSRIGMGLMAVFVALAGAFGSVGQAGAVAVPLAYTEYPFTTSELADWMPDRTTPSGGYESVSYGGRDDVLKMSIDTTAAAPYGSDGFHRTEGLQRALPAGTLAVRADVYVPSNWENAKVRAGLWGVGAASDDSISSYPVIEFTTTGEGDFTGWRWWDGDNGGWYTLPDVAYRTNAWNRLAIVAHDGSFDFYVNGDMVATQSSPDSVGFSAAILNSYNYADQGTNYDVYWSRFAAGHEAQNPTTKLQCAKNNWSTFGFSNQGQCVRFVENGKDSRL